MPTYLQQNSYLMEDGMRNISQKSKIMTNIEVQAMLRIFLIVAGIIGLATVVMNQMGPSNPKFMTAEQIKAHRI